MSRSIADQSVTELGGPVSVLARQRKDHVTLDRLLHDLHRTSGESQDAVLQRLYRLVFPHAFAEEAVLWPTLRRVLPDGHELSLDVEQEHQEVNELVTRLEDMGHDAPERAAVLERLTAVLREDVRDEEDVLLPRLQEAVSARDLRRLGALWEVVRRVAPTRAHPVVARRPPGNVISAVPLSILDRLRDLLDAGARRGPQRVAPALRTVSRGLTHAAHRVEHLPLLRIGEDPSTRSDGPQAA
ncbi:hemerythrin domain-containing protein [Georgenia wangjunii]|uniref:hemerythrin domain-containing protein n=1 Tax=Georgenia wangjunii TaxID=3117730 RepID=UPI002F25F8DC